MTDTPTDLRGVVNLFLDLINITLPVLAGIALLVFFKGLLDLILNAGDTKAIDAGKKTMVWGLVALFVMVSVWGILAFFYRDFGFSRPFGIPLLPTRE